MLIPTVEWLLVCAIWKLRYVTYALMAGDSSVLDDRCLNGLRETCKRSAALPGSTAAGVQR